MSEHDDKPKSSRFSIPTPVIVSFVVGVVIPLLAAGIPLAADYFKNQDDFSYNRLEPIFFRGKLAYSMEIANKGRVVEHGVEVWIAAAQPADIQVELDPSMLDVYPIKVRDEKGFKVVSLGDLRADERRQLSIMRTWEEVAYSSKRGWFYPAFFDRVQSNERVAKYVPRPGTGWHKTSAGAIGPRLASQSPQSSG